jgi:hypothetical protein
MVLTASTIRQSQSKPTSTSTTTTAQEETKQKEAETESETKKDDGTGDVRLIDLIQAVNAAYSSSALTVATISLLVPSPLLSLLSLRSF